MGFARGKNADWREFAASLAGVSFTKWGPRNVREKKNEFALDARPVRN